MPPFLLIARSRAFDWYRGGEIPIIAAFDAKASSFLYIQVNQVPKFMTDQSHQCVIIGIAGASASGKSLIASTLYRELREQVGDEHIGVIPEDSYYKDQSHLSMEERVKTNYDHPSAMDHSLLFQHLQSLKRGDPLNYRSTAMLSIPAPPRPFVSKPKKSSFWKGSCC